MISQGKGRFSHRITPALRGSVQGFSLLETLVALVVLSIGLLGIAALHVEGLRSGQQALLQTKAISLAADMADRIRANPTAAANYVTNGAAPGGLEDCADSPGSLYPGNDCTPVAMADADVAAWIGQIDANSATGLPGGLGVVELVPNVVPPQFNITINWSEQGEPRSHRLTVQP